MHILETYNSFLLMTVSAKSTNLMPFYTHPSQSLCNIFPLNLHQPDDAHLPKPPEFQRVGVGGICLVGGLLVQKEMLSEKKKKKLLEPRVKWKPPLIFLSSHFPLNQ